MAPDKKNDKEGAGDKAGSKSVAAAKAAASAKAAKPPPPPPPTARDVLHLSAGLLTRFVESRDARLLLRAVRYNAFLRAHLPLADAAALAAAHGSVAETVGAPLPPSAPLFEDVAAVRPDPVRAQTLMSSRKVLWQGWETVV